MNFFQLFFLEVYRKEVSTKSDEYKSCTLIHSLISNTNGIWRYAYITRSVRSVGERASRDNKKIMWYKYECVKKTLHHPPKQSRAAQNEISFIIFFSPALVLAPRNQVTHIYFVFVVYGRRKKRKMLRVIMNFNAHALNIYKRKNCEGSLKTKISLL